MKFRAFLLIASALSAAAAHAQTQVPQNAIEEARRLAELERQRQAVSAERLKAVSDAKYSRNTIPARGSRGIRFNPSLTDADKRAVAVDEEIKKKYGDLLKHGKAGVLRLQNADICTPNKMIVAAEGGCPNNVTAKATAFSFRVGDYVSGAVVRPGFQGADVVVDGGVHDRYLRQSRARESQTARRGKAKAFASSQVSNARRRGRVRAPVLDTARRRQDRRFCTTCRTRRRIRARPSFCDRSRTGRIFSAARSRGG